MLNSSHPIQTATTLNVIDKLRNCKCNQSNTHARKKSDELTNNYV